MLSSFKNTVLVRNKHCASSAPVRPCRCKAISGVQKPTYDAAGFLTESQVDQFQKDGFLVIEGFASQDEVTALRNRADALVEKFDPATISIFSTRNQTADEYFLDSSNNISFFFEEKAFDEEGKLRQAKALSINKIGHAMHDLDPVFRAFSRSPRVSAVMKSLGYKRPLPVQSMYIFKQPKIGGEVVPHQDSSYIYTQPLSCVGLWWALEDASRDNGCLWAQPGVHTAGLLRKFYVKQGKVQYDRPAPKYELDKFIPLECPAGTLVLLQGENVHYSAENTSPVSRHSYSMHLVEGTAGTVWSADNWLQRRRDFPFEPLYQL
mmetsp:Transcript_33968/g.75309  ORF Transcript_33968/g.75309 Transcript_33968/m.75309 type:complete len:321 (+) Transcript_33968:122-1084(+)